METTADDKARTAGRTPPATPGRTSESGPDEGHVPADQIDQAVADFQAGINREASFQRIVEIYYRPIKGFFARRVFSPEDGLELTQETFLSLYRGLDGFRREARFRSWAFKIAHTTYLKWLKRRLLRDTPTHGEVAASAAATAQDDQVAVYVDEETPLDGVLRKEARQRLGEAVEELPEQERKCVTLRVYHDLSHREIAEFLRLKIGTVKAHLHHARQKLRAKLHDSLGSIDF